VDFGAAASEGYRVELAAIWTYRGGVRGFCGNVLEKSRSYHVLFVLAGAAFPLTLLFINLFVPRWEMAEL
jgi:hypothetical protein